MSLATEIDTVRGLTDEVLRSEMLASLKEREAVFVQAARSHVENIESRLSHREQALHIVYNERGLPNITTSSRGR